MVLIKEMFPDDHKVIIQVDGMLDLESIPVLKTVCEYHLQEGKKIMLNLEGLINISREGRDFLNEGRNKFVFLNLPPFVKLDG